MSELVMSAVPPGQAGRCHGAALFLPPAHAFGHLSAQVET